MRMTKSFWAMSGLVAGVVGLVIASYESAVRAQLPAPNPIVAPLPAPSGPSTLPVPGQALAVPSLLAVPTPPAASPTPAARAFNCSCFGPGVGTRWMGEVSASGYFAARQTAVNACLSYAQVKQPSPALVAPADGVVPQVPPGFTNANAAGAVSATPLPDNLTISSGRAQQGCSECVCD